MRLLVDELHHPLAFLRIQCQEHTIQLIFGGVCGEACYMLGFMRELCGLQRFQAAQVFPRLRLLP